MNSAATACVLAPLVVAVLTSCAGRDLPNTQKSTAATTQPVTALAIKGSVHFKFRPAGSAAHGWVVILPGSDGLNMTTLNDDQHYERTAARLNRAGYDALLVDYRPAWREASDRPDGIVGDRIAWVAARAIRWVQQSHPHTADKPGAVVGWSKGGEGVASLLFDPPAAQSLGIAAAAMFYPSNEEGRTLSSQLPLLLLLGAADDVTPADQAQKFANAKQTQVVIFDNVRHGFDIASLSKPKSVRFPPLIGRKYTFAYDDAAAERAWEQLTRFLDTHLNHHYR